MLLRRVGFGSDNEMRMVEDAKSRIAAMIPGERPSDSDIKDGSSVNESSTRCWLLSLSRTVKSKLSRWIIELVATQIASGKS